MINENQSTAEFKGKFLKFVTQQQTDGGLLATPENAELLYGGGISSWQKAADELVADGTLNRYRQTETQRTFYSTAVLI